MNDYAFTLRFLAPGRDADELSVLLYEQIDDASLMGPDSDGSFLLEFDRRSTSLQRAITAAKAELLRVLPGVTGLEVADRRAAA